MVLVAVMMALLAGACSAPEYRTFEFEHSTRPSSAYETPVITRFSFEYRSEYRKVMTYAKDNRAAPLEVRFALATGAFGCVRPADTVFGVNIDWPDRDWRDAKEAVDRTIAGLVSPELVRERSSITVAGIPAELLVCDTAMPERAVFFDYEGRIWNIFVYSQSSQADQAKLDFEHVVASFRLSD